jgi:hypothetical protein
MIKNIFFILMPILFCKIIFEKKTHLCGGTMQIPLSIWASLVFKTCYYQFYRLVNPDGLAHYTWMLPKICHFLLFDGKRDFIDQRGLI